jgi:hypothetical protein
VASDGLDDRHGGRGSPTRSSGEGERACAKWDREASAGGAQKGAGVRGRATWPGISAGMRACWSMTSRGEGGSDKVVPQRRGAGARGNGSAHGQGGPARQRGLRGAWARATGADRAAPLVGDHN